MGWANSSAGGGGSLGAVRDHQILITASGPEAGNVLEALRQLVRENFGESAKTNIQAPSRTPAASKQERVDTSDTGTWKGVPVSEGFALGPLAQLSAEPAIPAELKFRSAACRPWSLLLNAMDARVALSERRSVSNNPMFTPDA